MRRLLSAIVLTSLMVLLSCGLVLAKDDVQRRGVSPDGGAVPRANGIIPAWTCKIPFNISNASFWTGLHIIPDAEGIHDFNFYFFNGDKFYANKTMSINAAGWIGTPESIITPTPFQSPTLMYVEAVEPFMVVQFIGKTDGLGYTSQTFYSYPYEWGWPFFYEGDMILY